MANHNRAKGREWEGERSVEDTDFNENHQILLRYVIRTNPVKVAIGLRMASN